MAVDLKTLTPDTSLPTDGFLFGADSQAAASPSVYSTQTVATTLLGSTALTGATVATDKPLLDLSQTWNAAGVTFTGLRFNAAGTSDANSAAGSLLLDLQLGGASKFNVSKAGDVAVGSRIYPTAFSNIGVVFTNGGFYVERRDTGWSLFTVGSNRTVSLAANVPLVWSNVVDTSGATADLFLRRADTATLQLGAADTTGTTAPTPQFLRVQSWSSSTNANQAGANFTIQGSRGTGTGAGGSIIFQVAPAGASGTAQNALQTVLQITGAGGLTGQDGATANTLALRNGANAQEFRLYNSYTDAANYERANFRFVLGRLVIQTDAGGSGTAGRISIVSPASQPLQFGAGGTEGMWQINSSGHFIAGTDNTYDIGANGANRPRNVYVGSGLIASNTSSFVFGTRSGVSSPATNVVALTNDALTSGAALQLREMTAPAAPATDIVRIYAEDNGSGKTRLMALFATGAAVQIAIEP